MPTYRYRYFIDAAYVEGQLGVAPTTLTTFAPWDFTFEEPLAADKKRALDVICEAQQFFFKEVF